MVVAFLKQLKIFMKTKIIKLMLKHNINYKIIEKYFPQMASTF